MHENLKAELDKLLAELDDSNTISSYKNERAARMIRILLSELTATERLLAEARAVKDSPVYMVERSYNRDDLGRAQWHIQEHLGVFFSVDDVQRMVSHLEWEDKFGDDYTYTEIDPGTVPA